MIPHIKNPFEKMFLPAGKHANGDTKPKPVPVAKRKNTRKMASQSRKKNRKRG